MRYGVAALTTLGSILTNMPHNKYSGDGALVAPPTDPTPQSVYDKLLDAATRNVSVRFESNEGRMLAQLVQEILARVRTLEEAAARDAEERTELSNERDTLEHDADVKPPTP